MFDFVLNLSPQILKGMFYMTHCHGGRIYSDLNLSLHMRYEVVKRVSTVSPGR